MDVVEVWVWLFEVEISRPTLHLHTQTHTHFGEMAERSNAAVSKTVVPFTRDRGFESPSLREKSVSVGVVEVWVWDHIVKFS